MTTVTLLSPIASANYAPASGNRYTADSNGLITGVPIGTDIHDLVNDGCVVLGFGVIGRNNYNAVTDPGAGNDVTQDYAPGSFWVNITNGRVWVCHIASAGVAAWALAVVPGVGVEPSSNLEQFGSGGATMLSEGNIYRTLSAAGISPGSTLNDNVLANYSLAANSLDGISQRGLMLSANGTFANNTNNKEVKLWIGATSAVVGSPIVGGTAICDSGIWSTLGLVQWGIDAQVQKYGAANSNTQLGFASAVVIGTLHGGFGSGASALPQLLTLTENAAINISVTGNAGTAAADIALREFYINALN